MIGLGSDKNVFYNIFVFTNVNLHVRRNTSKLKNEIMHANRLPKFGFFVIILWKVLFFHLFLLSRPLQQTCSDIWSDQITGEKRKSDQMDEKVKNFKNQAIVSHLNQFCLICDVP